MRKLLVALLLLVPFIAAPPAQASVFLGTFTYDCNNPVDVTITGDPGDVAVVDSVNCPLIPIGANGWSPPLLTSDFTNVGGLFYLNRTQITLPSSWSFIYLVAWQYGLGGPLYGIKLNLTSGGGGGGSSSAPSAAPAGPGPLGQGLGVPESGDCRDINDEDAGWATDLKGGWFIGWSTWRREDGTVFHDGWVCKRTIEYVNGEWRVKPLTDEPRSLEEKNREIERLQQGS